MASYTLHIQYVDRPAETRTFTQAKVTLGRDSGDVVLHDTQVSGRHGEITFENGTLRYTDVGSTNGSFLLQGQRVANIELTPGIALRLGNSLITVQVIDAPNVAGKGRTMIAGPGMAPGFPAPMRAPVSGGATPIPRPAPIPAPAPPGPPPGGFAFAPTAQLQGPVPPGGMPSVPQPGGFVPQPAPMPGRPAPMPAPMAPAPQPVMAAPQPAPPGPPPGTLPGAGPAPMAAPPGPASIMPASPTAPAPAPAPAADVYPEPGQPGEQPAADDVVGAIKQALMRGVEVFTPVAAGATLLIAAVMVPLALVAQLGLMILPLGLAAVLALLLTLVQLAAMVLVVPALYRYILGAYLGEPVDLRATVQGQVANAKDVIVNCFIPGLVLGVFAGPIYFVEGKKLAEVIARNFNLLGRSLVPLLGALFGTMIAVSLAVYLVSWILGLLPFGGLLASLFSNVVYAIMLAFFAAFSVANYFDLRRRFEGGDPEGEARARLAAAALPPA